jgi:hypothetical protein
LIDHGLKRCRDRALPADNVPIEIGHGSRESERAPRAGPSLFHLQVGENGIVKIRLNRSGRAGAAAGNEEEESDREKDNSSHGSLLAGMKAAVRVGFIGVEPSADPAASHGMTKPWPDRRKRLEDIGSALDSKRIAVVPASVGALGLAETIPTAPIGQSAGRRSSRAMRAKYATGRVVPTPGRACGLP